MIDNSHLDVSTQSTDILLQNLKDYLSNEEEGYGDESETITYGESIILSICEELKNRGYPEDDELIEMAELKAIDIQYSLADDE